MNDLAEKLVAMWSDPEARPLFRGRLLSDDGCCCAQGQALRCAGRSDDYLRELRQIDADLEVAKLLGISRAHSVLLRRVNDREDGCPQDVLSAPEKILGSEASRILAFWHRLDTMTAEQWVAVVIVWAAAQIAARAAQDTAWKAAQAASGAAGTASGAVARAVAWAVGTAALNTGWIAALNTGWIAAGATLEIQGHSLLSSLFFLPLFGIDSVEELDQ